MNLQNIGVLFIALTSNKTKYVKFSAKKSVKTKSYSKNIFIQSTFIFSYTWKHISVLLFILVCLLALLPSPILSPDMDIGLGKYSVGQWQWRLGHLPTGEHWRAKIEFIHSKILAMDISSHVVKQTFQKQTLGTEFSISEKLIKVLSAHPWA